MRNETIYDGYTKDAEFERLMEQGNLIMDVTENFCRILAEKGVKRTRLAQLMGKTRGYVSQLLNSRKNLTLRSLSDIAYCLGYRVNIVFSKKAAESEQMKLEIDWGSAQVMSFPEDRIEMADDYFYFGPKLSRLGS